MQIQYFAANQNVVFIPALLALLAATVLICLPIIFGPRFRRSKRRRPLLVLDVVVVAALLVGTALLAGIGFRTLGDERSRVGAMLQQRYGVQLDGGQVGELVDGGKPKRAFPDVAAAAELENPQKPKTLQLVPTTTHGDVYELTIGGKPWPAS